MLEDPNKIKKFCLCTIMLEITHRISFHPIAGSCCHPDRWSLMARQHSLLDLFHGTSLLHVYRHLSYRAHRSDWSTFVEASTFVFCVRLSAAFAEAVRTSTTEVHTARHSGSRYDKCFPCATGSVVRRLNLRQDCCSRQHPSCFSRGELVFG